MSTIAWDGKIIASDRQGTSGTMRTAATKLFKINEDTVVGFVGNLDQGMALLNWVKKGLIEEDYPDFQKDEENGSTLIVARKTGLVYYHSQPVPILVLDERFAWGSGRDFAIGAMEMGADAVKAIEIASKYDVYSGMGNEWYSLD